MDYVALDPIRGAARRRGARALRRVLPQLPRRRRRSGDRRDGGDRAGELDAVLLAGLHASRSRTNGRGRSSGRRRRSISPSGSARGSAARSAARRVPGLTRAEGIDADGRRPAPLARLRRAPRRGPVPGEPLQGRHLAVSGVRAAGRRLPRDPRSRRLAAARRPVRSVERDRRRLRSDRVSRARAAARRDDARLGSIAGARARRSRICGRATARPATRTSSGTARSARG